MACVKGVVGAAITECPTNSTPCAEEQSFPIIIIFEDISMTPTKTTFTRSICKTTRQNALESFVCQNDDHKPTSGDKCIQIPQPPLLYIFL